MENIKNWDYSKVSTLLPEIQAIGVNGTMEEKIELEGILAQHKEAAMQGKNQLRVKVGTLLSDNLINIVAIDDNGDCIYEDANQVPASTANYEGLDDEAKDDLRSKEWAKTDFSWYKIAPLNKLP